MAVHADSASTSSRCRMTGRNPGRGWPLPILVVSTLTLGVGTGVAWTRTTLVTQPEAVSSGVDLFQAKGCATCHNGPSSIARVAVGPNLANLPSVAASRQPGVSATDYVRRSITSPDSFVVAGFPAQGMGAMPTLAVSPAEVSARVEYLLSPAGTTK